MIRIGSMCSGYGGLDEGAVSALRGRVVWHSEVNEGASAILKYRAPDVPNHGDLTKYDWSRAEPVDALCVGFPCQPFSAAGLRRGVDDERHLFPHIVQAIEAMRARPTLIVIENVMNLVSIQGGTVWAYVLAELERLGYGGRWNIVPAAAVGAPHLRRRVFLLAGLGRPGGFTRDPQRFSKTGVPLLPTPRSSDQFGPGRHGDGGPDLRTVVSLLPTPTTSMKHSSPNHANASGTPYLTGVEIWMQEWEKFTPAIRCWEQATGIPAPLPTVPGSRSNRVLNPAFAEWMMGAAPGHVTDVPGLSRAQQLTAIGNGVVSQQAAYALRTLLTGRAEH